MFSLVVNSMRAFSFEQDSFIGESLWEEEGVAKYLPGGLWPNSLVPLWEASPLSPSSAMVTAATCDSWAHWPWSQEISWWFINKITALSWIYKKELRFSTGRGRCLGESRRCSWGFVSHAPGSLEITPGLMAAKKGQHGPKSPEVSWSEPVQPEPQRQILRYRGVLGGSFARENLWEQRDPAALKRAADVAWALPG